MIGQVADLVGRASPSARRRLGKVRRRLRRYAPRLPERMVDGVYPSVLASKRREILAKRSFGPADLDRLAQLLGAADEVVSTGEAFARREDWPERFLALRHDTDHDIENSVRLAEWEASHGWRSTYFVLHTDWYWGVGSEDEPAAFVLKALDRIASLGHEIGVHNNAITAGLLTGREPRAVLEAVLTGLRRHGFEITGTVAHGDPLCRLGHYINYEMFTETPKPDYGPPDRVIALDDPNTGDHHELTLAPVSMKEFGLTYEANWIGHTLYLSDTGGRWNVPFGDVEEQFVSEGGYLQVLQHPVWWALGGEPFTPRPTISVTSEDGPPSLATRGDRSAPPFKIVVRGDCCSRRAVDLNRDLFGMNPVMVRDEKARTDFFVDHATVGSPARAEVERVMDVASMSNSLRHYALGQVDRTTLDVTDARLIVIDNYSDMNFSAWRHRGTGQKLWIHPAFLRDREAFEKEYENVGLLSLEESIDLHVRLIEMLRAKSGMIPVLYLNQPIAFYPKLRSRAEFRDLGRALEERLPGVFAGDVEDDELDPDDVGSCGPGQTLHFSGRTYRRMVSQAMEKGLAEWLKQPIAIPS